MSYQQALHALRWAITLAFTLRSLKTSLLSAANQLAFLTKTDAAKATRSTAGTT